MRIRHSLIPAAMTLALCLPGAAFAQSRNPETQMATIAGQPVRSALQTEPGSLQPPSAAVVKLRIQRANGADETATGLFVGIRGQNAYFITALHAIQEDPASEYVTMVKNIQLQFRNSESFEASAETKYDEVLDLGVVRTPAAALPRNLPKVTRKNPREGTQVHIIGNPAGGDWSVWSGSVQKDSVGDNPRLFRTNTDTSLVGGYSGGPVFDYDGAFLGMHSKTTDSYGIAAKSRSIVDQLTAWNLPTDNLTAQPLARPPGRTAVSNEEAERRAINSVLNQYESAYSRRDAEALWKIWPDAPASTRKTILDSFGQARSIRVTLSDRQIDPAGSATARYTQEYVPNSGSAQTVKDSISFELVKKNGAWVITSVK